MKKVIILLTLLLAVAPVFAEPNIVMNAEIEANGSSITDPGGTEDPINPIIKGPVNVYLLYSTKALEGAVLNITDIVTDMKPIKAANIEGGFDLTNDGKTGNDALYLYLYAGYNTASDAMATVKFSSTGWKYGDEGDAVIPLIFTSKTSTYDSNLTCKSTDTPASEDTGASAEFTFKATGATQNLTSFLAGISTVTWKQDSGYLAGSYTATITIEVTPAQA